MNLLTQLAFTWLKAHLKDWLQNRGLKLPEAKVVSLSTEGVTKLAKAFRVSDPMVARVVGTSRDGRPLVVHERAVEGGLLLFGSLRLAWQASR